MFEAIDEEQSEDEAVDAPVVDDEDDSEDTAEAPDAADSDESLDPPALASPHEIVNPPDAADSQIPWTVPGVAIGHGPVETPGTPSGDDPASALAGVGGLGASASVTAVRGRLARRVAALSKASTIVDAAQAAPTPSRSPLEHAEASPTHAGQVPVGLPQERDVVSIAGSIGDQLSGLPADVGQVAPDALAAIAALLPVSTQIRTLLAQLVDQADRDGLCGLDGSKSILAHLASALPIGYGQAKAALIMGKALAEHLPSTRAALRAGILSHDAGADLVKFTTSQACIAALDLPVPADARTDEAMTILRHTIDTHTPATDNDPQACTARESSTTGTLAAADPQTDPATGTGATTVAQTSPGDTAPEPGGPAAAAAGADTGPGPQVPVGWVRCEDWLIARGIELTASRFRRLLNYWAAMIDTAAHEHAYQEAEADAYISAGQTLDCCHIQGKLAPEDGKTLLAALETFRPTYDADHPTGIAERNAQALVTIARIALETNLAGDSAAARPHIGLTISWETFTAMATHAGQPAEQLQAMAGLPPAMWADTTGPIPPTVTAGIACDSDITRIVFGPAGQIINVGRTARVIKPALRAAIIARDKHCIFPRCDAPPVLCQAHHLHRWSHGGKTDADNLALLCTHHHRWIHANNITIQPRAADPSRTPSKTDSQDPGRTPPEPGNPGSGRALPTASGRAGLAPHSNDPGRTLPTGPEPSHARPPSPAEHAIATIQGTLLDTQPAYDFIDRHGQPIG